MQNIENWEDAILLKKRFEKKKVHRTRLEIEEKLLQCIRLENKKISKIINLLEEVVVVVEKKRIFEMEETKKRKNWK